MAKTNAERQAAWRARREQRLREAGASDALNEQIAGLRRENDVLREENAKLRQRRPQARTAVPLPADPDRDEAVRLRAEVARWRKLAGDYKKRLGRIADAPRGVLIISAADRRKIMRCLHPDTTTDRAMQKRLTEASQIFNSLPAQVAE